MAEADAPDRAPLDEVMLAMDVVDTLRHRQSLIERELGQDDRDEQLIERLRGIYADQGIEVSDAALASGVVALRENRFVYTPPEPGLAVTLAGWYVNRGRVARRGAATAGVLGAVGLGYQYGVVAPGERRVEEQVLALNEGVRRAAADQTELAARIERVRASLAKAGTEAPAAVAAAVRSRRAEGESGLAGAEADLASAAAVVTPDEYQDGHLGSDAETRLERRLSLVTNAGTKVDRAEGALAGIRELAALPAALEASHRAALALAADATGKSRAEGLHGAGAAALAGGDVAAARGAITDLDRLSERLGQAYTLRIVSAPGEQSGVWRVPEGNRTARNHYLIVAAVDAAGQRLALPIESEEDGRTEVVEKWGVRVDAQVFERVRADKSDDGVLQQDVVGAKRRGQLDVEYALPVLGGAITRW